MTQDPYRSYNFNLLIEGVAAAGFVSAQGLGADMDVIAFREAGSGAQVRHLPGRVHYQPLVLEYGISVDHGLWDWFRQCAAGQVERRNVSLVQFENDGQTEAFRWNLMQAWPSSFRAAPMNARTSEIAIQQLTLVYDRLERD